MKAHRRISGRWLAVHSRLVEDLDAGLVKSVCSSAAQQGLARRRWWPTGLTVASARGGEPAGIPAAVNTIHAALHVEQLLQPTLVESAMAEHATAPRSHRCRSRARRRARPA